MENEKYTVPAVAKALDILLFLKEQKYWKSTLTEIAAGLALNKSSCFAILRTLQAKKLVQFDEITRKYSLGMVFLEFASAVTAQVNHISLAKPIIERLAQETHLTYFLAERIAADTVMIIEKAEFRERVHVTFPIGERRPITAGSTGKVFLAFMDESERETVLAELKLVQYTPVTITDRKRLADEFSEVRTRGYSINFGEYTIGINGVAAPVFDEHEKVVMTITAVGFPQTLHNENIHSIGEQTYDAAREITRLLNGKLPPSLTRPAQYVLASDQLTTTAISE